MLVRRHRRRRRPWTLLALLVTVFAVLAPTMPAHAEPGSGEEPSGAKSLREKLEETSVAYYDARAKLTASQKRQVTIEKRLREAELALTRLDAQVSSIAASWVFSMG
jgi:hypothetical protein